MICRIYPGLEGRAGRKCAIHLRLQKNYQKKRLSRDGSSVLKRRLASANHLAKVCGVLGVVVFANVVGAKVCGVLGVVVFENVVGVFTCTRVCLF